VKTITDSVNAANGQTLNYDVLNRISSAASGTGGYGSWSWTWDKDRNVATQVIAGTTTTFTPVTGSSKLSKWVSGSTTINVTSTAAGNVNLLKNGSTTLTTLNYNAANEMFSAPNWTPYGFLNLHMRLCVTSCGRELWRWSRAKNPSNRCIPSCFDTGSHMTV